MAKPLVSVVVPTRNSALTLGPCLESIANQSYPRIEIIVVDRASKDETIEIARHHLARVLRGGPERSAQRNAGARAARGEWVLFIDSDMILDPTVIESCVRAAGPENAAIVPELGLGSSLLARLRALEKRCYLGSELVEAPRFFPRPAFLVLGGYDAWLEAGEDWELTDRWIASGRRVVRAESAVHHDDRSLTLAGLLDKRFRYGRAYLLFLRKDRKGALRRFRPRRLSSMVRTLAHRPAASCALVVLKGLEFLAFGLGLLAALLGRDDDALFGRTAYSASLVGRTSGELVLDIGCSGGWLGRAIGDRRLVVGVDTGVSPKGLSPGSVFIAADARELPFADRSFEVVTLFEVMEHVPVGSEASVLTEAMRVLRPGGTFLLSTPNRHPVGVLLDPAWWLRGHRHYRAPKIQRLLEGAGFSGVRLWTRGALADALHVPAFYLFKRMRTRIPFERTWRGAIDREYRRAGWYTTFAAAQRPVTPADEPAPSLASGVAAIHAGNGSQTHAIKQPEPTVAFQ